MMKRKILFLMYGFVLILIWFICFISRGMSDSYTAAMGLSFTFIGTYLLQKEYGFALSLKDKIAFVFFPILYAVTLYFTMFSLGNIFTTKKYNLYQLLFYFHLINPLNISLIVLLLGLTKMKDLTKFKNIFIFVYITIFYSYFFQSQWAAIYLGASLEKFSKEPVQYSDELETADTMVNLQHFSFINPKLDTTILKTDSSKYILLETWSETCLPCIKAMGELPDFYRSIGDKVDVYYLYENSKENGRNEFDKIFSFKWIEDKQKILIDINQNLYTSLDMQGYPYFLLFDANGRLVFKKSGYYGKKMLTKGILESIR